MQNYKKGIAIHGILQSYGRGQKPPSRLYNKLHRRLVLAVQLNSLALLDIWRAFFALVTITLPDGAFSIVGA